MAPPRQIEKPLWLNKIKEGCPFFIIYGLAFFISGIVLICLSSVSVEICSNRRPSKTCIDTIVVDYTNCIDVSTQGSPNEQTCIESQAENQFCICYVPFNLTFDLKGDVIIYYELDFDQFNLRNEDNFYQSRDDNQLNGILNDHPSEACEPFAYEISPEGKKLPIAPCGAIADAMFNDTFNLQLAQTSSYVPILHTGIIREEDKQGFHNPPLHGNLTLRNVFQNFSKPKNWTKNIWELSKSDENNGFENEMFIGWMKTSWIRKPLWRVDTTNADYRTGLKKGRYTLRAEYNYPYSWYNGTRKAVISNCNIHAKLFSTGFVIGIVAVVIGTTFLILAGIILFFIRNRTKPAPRDAGKIREEEPNREPEVTPLNKIATTKHEGESKSEIESDTRKHESELAPLQKPETKAV